jgi:hypothetical protein
MKTLKYLFLLSSVASSPLFGEAIVNTSGNWSSSATWADSTVPATSSSSQLDFLRFSSSGLNLNVDSTQYVNTVDVGANDDTTINIAAGNTLYLTGHTISSVISADSQTQNITFSGDGTLRFDISRQREIVRGNVVFDVETYATDSLYFSDKGTVTFKKDFTSTNQISVGGTWNFIIESGVNFSLSKAFNLWGGTGTFTLKEGATVENKEGGVQFNNGDISGNIICKGSQNGDANRYAFKSINAVYNATATITQTGGGALRSILSGNTTSSAAAGKLSFESKLSIDTGATITLNSSNAFTTEGASTQGESNFYLMNQKIEGGFPNRYETLTESNVNFILNADNDFGTFFFYGASVLSMTTNGNSVNIGKFDVVPDSSGSVSAYFTDLVDFTVKINSLDNITLFEDGDSIRAENVFFGSEDSKEYAYLLQDTQNGGWWINATAAVPEPSECAAVFGVFALALAAALKRKNK